MEWVIGALVGTLVGGGVGVLLFRLGNKPEPDVNVSFSTHSFHSSGYPGETLEVRLDAMNDVINAFLSQYREDYSRPEENVYFDFEVDHVTTVSIGGELVTTLVLRTETIEN